MKYIVNTILIALCLAAGAEGQPMVRGVHTYDPMWLFDIFPTESGGYVACGLPIHGFESPQIMKVNSEFEDEWGVSLAPAAFYSVVELDDEGVLCGGYSQGSFFAVKLNRHGESLWQRNYGGGPCVGVIELKNNCIVLFGNTIVGNTGLATIILANSEGDVIWTRRFRLISNGGSIFYGGRETEDGIVAVGFGSNGDQEYQVSRVLKVDFEGNLIWMSDSLQMDENGATITTTIVSMPGGGFLVGGRHEIPEFPYWEHFLAKISDEGEWIWTHQLEGGAYNNALVQLVNSGQGGFVFGCTTQDFNGKSGTIYRLTPEGDVSWRRSLRNGNRDLEFDSVVYGIEGTFVACGQAITGDQGGGINQRGAIVEIEPEVIGPTIVNAIPLSTDQVVLPGDSILFVIGAENQWNDEITYAFFRDEEQIAADSSVTVHFNDLGEFLITGRAYSGGDSDQVVWNVEVTDFYIAAQTPDTLGLGVRRGNQLAFSIDSIRAVGGNENIDYLWQLLNLDTGARADIGENSRVIIEFGGEGRFQVDGLAYRGEQSDRVVWTVRVRAGILNDDEQVAELEAGDIFRGSTLLFNDEADTLHWQAVARIPGDAGADPWTLRQNFAVSEITGDDRIDGLVFNGESFFLAGANGNNPNMIYRLSREGELLGSFPQPGHSRYGFKDMEWDGELIWGCGEDTVFAIDRESEVVHRWLAPYDPTNNIAYDPEDGVLWLGSITTDIKAYDCEGNYLDRTLDNPGLRTYGLGWFADDPDDFCLYALNVPGNDTIRINKFNTLTGEMAVVATLPPDSAISVSNAFICRDFDKYQGWVMMTMANIPANMGGDQLRVIQLQPNNEWLTVTPESGEIPPDGSVEVEIRISTARWNGDWAFEPGEYEGEIVFSHDGQDGRDVLPVHLTVIEPNDVPKERHEVAGDFGLYAPYPNPFNASTTITFTVGRDCKLPLQLVIYDINGRIVANLLENRERLSSTAGKHRIVWDTEDIPAGIYLVRLSGGRESKTEKLLLIR